MCAETNPNTGKPDKPVEFYEWLSFEDKMMPEMTSALSLVEAYTPDADAQFELWENAMKDWGFIKKK